MKKYLWYLLALSLMLTGCAKKENTAAISGDMTESLPVEEREEQSQEKGLVFPCELDEGGLVVNSLFQSSIENPDCGNEYADNIASLEIINQSGKFLDSAEITLYMNDGTELHMVIRGIPAEKKVWVFDNQNRLLEDDAVCVSIDCETDYLNEEPIPQAQIAVETEETTITLLNQSGEVLNGLTVECHCSIDGVYYGGLTYSYLVDELPSNGNTVIEAEECFLGSAEVVRITG